MKHTVIPAQAGIQLTTKNSWIPDQRTQESAGLSPVRDDKRAVKFKFFVLGLIIFGVFSIFKVVPQAVHSQSKYGSACTQYPAGVTTPSIKDSSIVDQEEYKREGATWQYRWEADCSQGCSNNSDCTANTVNAPAVATGTSAWCFEFTDGNRCMILTTTDKGVGEDKNKSGGKFGQGGAKPGQSGPRSVASNTSCKDPQAVKTTYYDAKVANNLVRFYAILKGVSEYCVPADLGVGTQETAEAIDGGGSGRLLLCSGKAGASGTLPDLVWKVAIGNSLKTADKAAPQRDTLEAGFNQKLEEAKAKAGI